MEEKTESKPLFAEDEDHEDTFNLSAKWWYSVNFISHASLILNPGLKIFLYIYPLGKPFMI